MAFSELVILVLVSDIAKISKDNKAHF